VLSSPGVTWLDPVSSHCTWYSRGSSRRSMMYSLSALWCLNTLQLQQQQLATPEQSITFDSQISAGDFWWTKYNIMSPNYTLPTRLNCYVQSRQGQGLTSLHTHNVVLLGSTSFVSCQVISSCSLLIYIYLYFTINGSKDTWPRYLTIHMDDRVDLAFAMTYICEIASKA